MSVTISKPASYSKPLSYSIFDGLQWNSSRGLGRFAAQLRRHLERTDWQHLSYPRPPWGSPLGRIILNELVEPVWNRVLSPDVAIYPHNVLPLLTLRTKGMQVLVLHDLLFLDSDNRSAGNFYRSSKWRRSMARADLILTVSEASRIRILEHLDRECPVMVIPNALAQEFDKVVPQQTQGRTGAVKIIHFGGDAPTKNTKNVLRALALVRQAGHDTHLLLAAMAGKREIVEQWQKELALQEDALTVLPRMSDSELIQAYANAEIHCMPSTGEGFGIPVIEAARCGIPNVLSPLPVFHELIGNDAIFTASLSAEDIARSLLQCMSLDTRPLTARARTRTDKFLFDAVDQTSAMPAFRAIEALAMRCKEKSNE